MRFFAVNLVILVFLSGVFGENANSSQAASQAEAQPKSESDEASTSDSDSEDTFIDYSLAFQTHFARVKELVVKCQENNEDNQYSFDDFIKTTLEAIEDELRPISDKVVVCVRNPDPKLCLDKRSIHFGSWERVIANGTEACQIYQGPCGKFMDKALWCNDTEEYVKEFKAFGVRLGLLSPENDNIIIAPTRTAASPVPTSTEL